MLSFLWKLLFTGFDVKECDHNWHILDKANITDNENYVGIAYYSECIYCSEKKREEVK